MRRNPPSETTETRRLGVSIVSKPCCVCCETQLDQDAGRLAENFADVAGPGWSDLESSPSGFGIWMGGRWGSEKMREIFPTSSRGLRRSGTVNRVKRPIEVAKNSCRPVRGIPQRPQFAPGHRVRHRERVAPQHVDVLVQQRRQPGHVLFLDEVALGTQLRQGRHALIWWPSWGYSPCIRPALSGVSQHRGGGPPFLYFRL